MSLFGPLFRYELTRLARRGLQPRLRAAFAGLLLIALFLSYLAAFPGVRPIQILTNIDEPLSLAATSRFGDSFLVSFLFIQAAVVVLVTPACAAGAIGEDKDRGTLDLLLTTALTSWEIVAGKLAARLVFVGSLLLTGLPIVTLLTLFGGVDMVQLVAGYVIALLTMVSLSAFSLYMSVVGSTLGATLVRTYWWVLVFVGFGLAVRSLELAAVVSPFNALLVMFEGGFRVLKGPGTLTNPGDLVVLYFSAHSVAASFFLVAAVQRLRSAEPPRNAPASEFQFRLPGEERPATIAVFTGSRPPRTWSVPKMNEADPFGWKERYFDGFFPWLRGRVSIVLSVASIPVLLLLVYWLGASLVVAVGLLMVFIFTGVGTAASVARERQRGTLDSLLLFPRDRGEILWAKLRKALGAGRWVALFPVGFAVLGTLYMDTAPFAALAIPFILLGWMLAAGGSGLWFSVRCATVERAVACWFVGAVLISLFPALISPLMRELHISPNATAICQGFSPLTGAINALPEQHDWKRDTERVKFTGAWIAAALAALFGLLFALFAARRFSRNE